MPAATPIGRLILNATVSYREVDRTEVLLLPGVFKFLQEAAITHANQFGTGTQAMVVRGESWVLNRIAVAIHRYPRFEEALRIETWSRGIKGFKGYRDFRVYAGREELLFSGSSLWLYVNIRTNSIIRVPAALAATFPVCADAAFCPDLESLDFPLPAAAGVVVPVTLRYSDIDVNQHVNNTAYLDLLQTALARAGRPSQPRAVRLKYARAISADTATVDVRLEPRGDGTIFSIESAGVVFAHGDVA